MSEPERAAGNPGVANVLEVLGDLLSPGHAVIAGSEEVRAELGRLLGPIGDLVVGTLSETRTSGETPGSSEKDRAARQLDWVAQVRSQLLAPLEEATTRERNLAVQRAMAAGVPASALVASSVLFSGRVSSGPWVSLTVTVNSVEPVLPERSVAEQVTVVGSSIGKAEPDSGSQVTGRSPSTTSVADGAS